MPTRYLKPGICDSEAIDRCSPLAECLFYRLLVNVDDFGRLDARPAVIRAKCFPLKDTITNKDTETLLKELQSCRLITLYDVGGAMFLQINKWDNVPRAQTSKCPAPPDGHHPREMLEIISEDDLEVMISESISSSGMFAGLKVISHQRQVRKDQSYFDIVLDTEGGQIGIELKRTRISNSAVSQVIKYKHISGIPFILIGAGIGVGVDISACEINGITVATYDENFNARVISSSSVIKRDFTLRAVVALTVTETVTVNRKPELKPETGTVVDASASPPKIVKSETDLQAACKTTWKAYSDAFFERYCTEPVINAKVRSQIKQFVQRIGFEESPMVAAHYLQSNLAFYVQRGHVVGNLLSDAEKLRTEWATGSSMTSTRARQIDRTGANSTVADEAMRILEQQEAA